MNRCTSTTAADRLVNAASRSERLPSTTLVSWPGGTEPVHDLTLPLQRSDEDLQVLDVSTRLPLVIGSTWLTPDSWAMVSCSFWLLPSSALAAESRKRPIAVLEVSSLGPVIRCQPHQLPDLVPLRPALRCGPGRSPRRRPSWDRCPQGG